MNVVMQTASSVHFLLLLPLSGSTPGTVQKPAAKKPTETSFVEDGVPWRRNIPAHAGLLASSFSTLAQATGEVDSSRDSSGAAFA